MRKAKLTARQKQAIATRKRIYNAALRLFEKHGFDQVTVNEICRKARVSKGTFYVYFESKEQVILDLFLKNDRMVDAFAAGELASIDDPVEKLMQLWRKALSYQQESGPDILEVSYRARASLNRSGKDRPTESRSSYKIVLPLIEESQKRGIIRKDLSAKDITRLVLRALDGLIHDWCIVNGTFDLISEAEKMVRVVLSGLRAGDCG